jgi:hypothetical protein
MAGVTQVHPVSVALNWEQVGKNITFFTVDYIDDISASTGPDGIIREVYDIIQSTCTIIAAGPLVDTGSQQTFGIEGDFSAAELAAMQVLIRAGTANATATVTATNLGILTAAVV